MKQLLASLLGFGLVFSVTVHAAGDIEAGIKLVWVVTVSPTIIMFIQRTTCQN
jgi:hypothetical protein